MKNIDNVFLEASKKLNLPLDTVRKAYQYAYKTEFYDKVMQGEGVSFYLPKFGTFRYSYLKVVIAIINTIQKIKRWKVSIKYNQERRDEIIQRLHNDLQMYLKIRRQLIEESKTHYNGNISRLLKGLTRRNEALRGNSGISEERIEIEVGDSE